MHHIHYPHMVYLSSTFTSQNFTGCIVKIIPGATYNIMNGDVHFMTDVNGRAVCVARVVIWTTSCQRLSPPLPFATPSLGIQIIYNWEPPPQLGIDFRRADTSTHVLHNMQTEMLESTDIFLLCRIPIKFAFIKVLPNIIMGSEESKFLNGSIRRKLYLII